jgi:hypothetical protein
MTNLSQTRPHCIPGFRIGVVRPARTFAERLAVRVIPETAPMRHAAVQWIVAGTSQAVEELSYSEWRQ